MKRRLWLILIFSLVVSIHVFAQGDTTIQQMLRQGERDVRIGGLLLQNDLSSNVGWSSVDTERRFLGVDDGAYRIEHAILNTPVRGLYDQTFDNVIIVVETTQLSEENDNGYGVTCRADPEDDHSGYYFLISGDGNARIFTYENFILNDLAEWTAVPEINTGQSTNQIVAVCVNSYLALYVNGTLAAEADNTAYRRGQVGFIAATYVSQTAVNVAFDDFAIYGASGEGLPFVPEFATHVSTYGDNWRDTIAELQLAGSIPVGGNLIFAENSTFITNTGDALFQPLALESSYDDIVLAGELTLIAADSNETECGFLSRVDLETNGEVASYFQLLVSPSEITVYSYFGGPDTNRTVRTYGRRVALEEPIHVLYILQGELATVYIDGELLVSGFEIADVGGGHGILIRAENGAGRCEGRNVWAYAIPDVQAGLCEASATATVNQRIGPGTTFDRAGTLAANTPLHVTGQVSADDGFIWWRLENDYWVREDVVTLSGDCLNVPVIEGW